MDTALASLLLDLSSIPDEEIIGFVRQKYIELYTDTQTKSGRRGELTLHDGEKAVFFEDRFEHAFFTSAYKTYRKYNKGAFDEKRAIRIRWIREILTGKTSGVEGRHIPSGRRDNSGRPILQRLYVLWDENYLIWLEYLTKTEKWKFSSAYVEPRGKPYIRKLTRMGTCFWRKMKSRD